MALNCFLNSAEPIKVYKVLVGTFVGNVGKIVGKINNVRSIYTYITSAIF